MDRSIVLIVSRNYSTPCSREMGSVMREARKRAGISSAELARSLVWSESKVSRVESGLYPVSERELSQFLGWCHTRYRDVKYAHELHTIDRHGFGYWLRSLDDGLAVSASRSLAYHESGAARVVSYESELMPVLLWVDAYARELLASMQREEAVQALRDRQTILGGNDPAQLVFLIHEQALRSMVGGPRVMHEQLLHLVLSMNRPNVRIRVVPADVGRRFGCRGAFELMECSKPHRSLVHVETCTGGLFIDDRAHVTRYEELCRALYQASLGEEQSRKFCGDLSNQYELASQVADC